MHFDEKENKKFNFLISHHDYYNLYPIQFIGDTLVFSGLGKIYEDTRSYWIKEK
jgi:hypothetical protein